MRGAIGGFERGFGFRNGAEQLVTALARLHGEPSGVRESAKKGREQLIDSRRVKKDGGEDFNTSHFGIVSPHPFEDGGSEFVEGAVAW